MVKVIFMGSPAIAVPILECLANHSQTEVICALTQPDKRVGRGHKMEACAVKQAAISMNIAVATPATKAELSAIMQQQSADLIIVTAYGRIIPEVVLNSSCYGAYNVHFSMLPRWRGASPVQAAILNGDTTTGVSIQRMVKALDQGPVLSKSNPVAITEQLGTAQLFEQLSHQARLLFEASLPQMLSPNPQLEQQDEHLATYAPLIKKEDGCIDWQKYSALYIQRMTRAFDIWPGCYSFVLGQRLQLVTVEMTNQSEPNADVGQITLGGIIKTIGGNLRLICVKPQGKTAMAWPDFIRGRPQLIGQRLGI